MRDESDAGTDPTAPRPPLFDGPEPNLAALLDAARRDATREGRLAAVSLTLFPVLMATVLFAFEPNTAAAFEDGAGLPILVAAGALTTAGAWWLWIIAAPPFAAFPRRRSILERQPQMAYELSAILQKAASYADNDVDVVDALDRAAPEDASHPSRVLARGLRVLLEPGSQDQADDKGVDLEKAEDDGRSRGRGGERSHDGGDERDEDGDPSPDTKPTGSAAEDARLALPDWLITTLQPGWTDSDPVETLNLVAVRIRAELQAAADAWPGRVRIAALVPFGVCILPSAVLLALLALI